MHGPGIAVALIVPVIDLHSISAFDALLRGVFSRIFRDQDSQGVEKCRFSVWHGIWIYDLERQVAGCLAGNGLLGKPHEKRPRRRASDMRPTRYAIAGIFKCVSIALVAGAASLPGSAQGQVTGNVGAVSNYFFRGVTQTDDGPAIQGGFDFAAESGFYSGVWLSNVDFGGKEDAEVNLYAGYGGAFGDSGVSWDAGAIYYLYPGGGDLDYGETYFGLGYGLLSASVAWTFWGEVSGDAAFDTGDLYYNLSLDLPFELEEFSVTAFAGYYDFDEDGNPAAGNELSYAHWGLSASRELGEFGSLSLNYEQTDGGGRNVISADDNANFWLGWTLEF